MEIGQWEETGLVRPADQVPDGPEPVTVWERRTKDGQRQRAVVYGSGTQKEPWVVQLRTERLAREALEPGQEVGEARWPTFEETQQVADLMPTGSIMALPVMASMDDREPPELERFTTIQLSQVGALSGTPAHQSWTGGIVSPNLTIQPGRA